MRYELIVRYEAERDIDEAYNWYEDQSWGLGKEFLRAIDAALFTTLRNPFAHQLIYKKFRRILLRRFPHALFYLVEDQKVIVTACFHQKRDPDNWIRRTRMSGK